MYQKIDAKWNGFVWLRLLNFMIFWASVFYQTFLLFLFLYFYCSITTIFDVVSSIYSCHLLFYTNFHEKFVADRIAACLQRTENKDNKCYSAYRQTHTVAAFIIKLLFVLFYFCFNNIHTHTHTESKTVAIQSTIFSPALLLLFSSFTVHSLSLLISFWCTWFLFQFVCFFSFRFVFDFFFRLFSHTQHFRRKCSA